MPETHRDALKPSTSSENRKRTSFYKGVMSDERWNPMPNNIMRPTPAQKPRVRGEEAWCLSRGERIATCELRDDTEAGAGWEVVVRHDDEIIVGRRCDDEGEARYYADAFKHDYLRSAGQRACVSRKAACDGGSGTAVNHRSRRDHRAST